MAVTAGAKPWLKRIAQAGYVAKGVVYALLGTLGFMTAFELGGGGGQASQSGVLQVVKGLPAGTVLLLLLAAGLLCYSAWRLIQTFGRQREEKKWPARLRYLASGAAYLALAYAALRTVFEGRSAGGDQNQALAGEFLRQPLGQVLVGLAALVFAGTGVYQVWYGLSEKYRKHVRESSVQSAHAGTLLLSGKVGYISRGAVWLVIGFLFGRAAVFSRASEAGDTSKAFRFVEASPLGSWLLAALGLGLVAYGIFNFIRARYERFV